MSDSRQEQLETHLVERVIWGTTPAECRDREHQIAALDRDKSWERAAAAATRRGKFAITVEKPGGVVVCKQDDVGAIAGGPRRERCLARL